MKSEVLYFQDLEEASQALALSLWTEICDTVKKKGCFALALSGGKTPQVLYDILANSYAETMPWKSVHLFWGDERFVPQNHPESNYKMAYHTLMSKISIPADNVHPIPTEILPPEEAALAYEKVLQNFFKTSIDVKSNQTFDLILLGIGVDGHTASLFPGNPALQERARWAVPVVAPHSFAIKNRITLTFSAINNSRSAIFLVSGEEKRGVVHSIIQNSPCSRNYPAALIHPQEKRIWYIAEKG